MVPVRDLPAQLCGRVSQNAGAMPPQSHATYIELEVPALVPTEPEVPEVEWDQAHASFASPGKWRHWMLNREFKESRAMHTQAHVGVAIHAFARRSGNPV